MANVGELPPQIRRGGRGGSSQKGEECKRSQGGKRKSKGADEPWEAREEFPAGE